MTDKKELALGAPALSVRIMQIYARMSPAQRWLLHSAATLIVTQGTDGQWQDVASPLITDFTTFNPDD